MADMQWLRLWIDITRDPKLRRHPHYVKWAWIAVLVIARTSPKPGYLLVGEGERMTEADLADEAQIAEAEASEALRIFRQQGMLVAKKNGVLFVKNWKKRQPDSDNVTARVRKHRAKTAGRVAKSETLQQRCGNVSGNVTETPPETETDTDLGPSEISDEISPGPASSARANALPPCLSRETFNVKPHGQQTAAAIVMREAERCWGPASGRAWSAADRATFAGIIADGCVEGCSASRSQVEGCMLLIVSTLRRDQFAKPWRSCMRLFRKITTEDRGTVHA